MFSAKSSTQDGKVMPWQSHVKIQFVKPSGGSEFYFFRNGCGDKNSRPSLGLNVEKWGPCHGLEKMNMFREAAALAVVFCTNVRVSKLFRINIGHETRK